MGHILNLRYRIKKYCIFEDEFKYDFMSLSQLEPQIVWKNFSALNEVPRPSKKEEKVIKFIKDFGERLGLETTVDKTGNVIIRKPATKGMEHRKPIILQAHLDMVCQKNNDVDFDFDTQGIQMYVEGDWVKAKGTTLGADNGLGVAAIMSVLESKDLPHPELEALFTIDEETGMTGAFGLEPNALNGEILLNLDTEEDDEIDIGCAGGIDVTATKTFGTEEVESPGFRLLVKGLQGGHSGMDIHKGLGNANKLLTRFLYLGLEYGIRLVEIDSGGLRNAIPREGVALFTVENKEPFLAKYKELEAAVREEYATIEPHLKIEIEPVDIYSEALSHTDSKKITLALSAAHNGVYRMSPDVENLVEASNNIARVELKKGKFQVLNLTRSSVESSKFDVAQQLKSAFELAEIPVTFSGSYPGWKPKPGAEIIQIMDRIYQEKFGDKPAVVACHAGLECGIIGANYPKMEMVSFGPTIKGAHSPDERASISSTQKFWDFLKDILANIPEQNKDTGF